MSLFRSFSRALAGTLLAAALGVHSMSAADDSSAFGSSEKNASALIGIFYDLKQNQKGEPVNGDYLQTLGQFLKSGWDENTLHRYFRGTRPVYATQVFIPHIGAGAAPKAFNLEKVVQPQQWFVVYKGQVSPPEDGTYRFVGTSDDVMAVAVNGKTCLVSNFMGTADHSGWKMPEPETTVMTKVGPLRRGDWFTCRKDQIIDLDILIGEYPGTAFGAWLFIEKKGVSYPTSGNVPVLPVFQVAKQAIPIERQPIPFSTDSPPWTCHQ